MRTWLTGGGLIATALAACAVLACALLGHAGDQRTSARAQGNAGDRKDNTPPRGFVALFNGTDLTNWQGVVPLNQRMKMTPEQYADAVEKSSAKVLPHWKIEDGALHYDGKGNSLQTAKDYGDFVLYVDWKIHPKGDSGIYLRGQPQVQIWDSDSLSGGLKGDRGLGSGGLWNNPKNSPGQYPLINADRPVGEWNTFRILMRGDQVTIHLNGMLVIAQAPLANYWEKGQPLPKTGPIELQHHGDELWFKNIYISEL
jgi:hypothetical protein